MTALLVIGILVLLIVAHEFGHFLAAKIFRVRVDEFGIGFPPRAYLLGKWGDTEYTFNWLPFGGFVKLFGEEEEDGQHGRGSFIDAARWKQAVILVAGVAANVVIAWALFASAYAVGIPHISEEDVVGGRLLITNVVPASPADAAGIHIGDEIVGIAGEDGVEPELLPEAVSAFMSERGGKDVFVEYKRSGATSSVVVRPAHAVVPDAAERPAIGVSLAVMTSEALPAGEAMRAASLSTYHTLRLSLSGLWSIIKGALSGAPNLSGVAGPVGIVGAVSEASRDGFGYVLALAGFISANLAIINLIPIPALDGGRLFIIGVEAVLRRRVSKLVMRFTNTLGIALIILLMVTVTYNDVARLLG